MSQNYSELEPRLVWKYFRELSDVPRCSKQEEKVREYLKSAASKLGLDYSEDKIGNIVVRKPATPGMEHMPTVILQGHMDMVCEKNNDVEHDFKNDPIKFKMEGEWLYADGTTLGADNGIGVATGLALLEDKDAVHGPLEVLVTVDEETGLTGAFNLEPGFLKGRKMLNLDSEEEDVIYIGCAGGADTKIAYTGSRVPLPEAVSFVKVTLKGLKGGHSGIDIDQGRANAVQLLARTIFMAGLETRYYLVDYKGGNMRNAISRECHAVVAVANPHLETFRELVAKQMEDIKVENAAIEKDTAYLIEGLQETHDKVFDRKSTDDIIGMLYGLPHGVMAMNMEIDNLVETSTNLAVAAFEGDTLRVQMSSRSSIASAIDATRAKIRCVAERFGAQVEEPRGYPGWKPNLQSPLLKTVAETHKQLFGIDPEKKAIHAGLECGIIGEKFPGMDMTSIGPHIEHPHCPEERVKMASVGKFYEFVKGVLKNVK